MLYTGYAIFLTWPLAQSPGTQISSPSVTGDLGASVSHVAYIVQHHLFPFAPVTLKGLNAPQGVGEPWVLNWASLPGQALLYGLGYAFGAVAGNAVFLWLGFISSGLSMFWLTRRLFGSEPAALLAGFAFAFYPFAVDKIAGHFFYMYGAVLVLALWRMLELAQRPGVRNGLLAGAATAFAMWFTPYFVLIAGVSFATMAVVVLAAGAARGETRAALKSVVVACAPIVVLFAGIGALATIAGSSATGAVRTQSIQELYTYSARWLEWVLPDRHNLIFGGATSGYLTSHLHGSNFSESSLYLGVSVIVLAWGGVALAIAGIRRAGRRAAAADIRILGAIGGAGVALMAAWFSSPPKVRVLGVWVPTPSWFVFHVTSTFRVYTRFVELLELGLCVLMAFALSRLFARRGRTGRLVLFGALGIVLVLDLWSRPPVRAIPITPPAAYAWLKDHPGGIVADYPITPAVDPAYNALFWQMIDHHPLFQGFNDNSETESEKLDLVDLGEKKTAHDLAGYGVRYVVVHPGVPGAEPANMRRQGYILRFGAPDASVWQVGAAPARTRVDPLHNFYPVEGGPGYEFRWMSTAGVMGVFASDCARCTGTVTFQSGSTGVPRTLTVREQSTGAVLERVSVPPGRTVPVRVPGVTLVNGQARLDLTTDVPAAVPKNGDPRLLSIMVQEPQLKLTGS